MAYIQAEDVHPTFLTTKLRGRFYNS